MALETQLVSMPFAQGLDSKTNPKLSAKPSLLTNMVFSGGTIQKRWGTIPLQNTIDSGGSFTTGGQLFPFDAELVRLNGGSAYGLGPAYNRWVTKAGGGSFTTITDTQLQRNTRTQSQFDQASANGMSVFVWLEAAAPQQGIHIAVLDEASGTWYQTGNTALGSTTTGTFPRCVAVGNVVLVFWKTGANLVRAVVDTLSPETVPTPATIRTDLSTTLGASGGTYNVTFNGFDACAFDGGAVVAYVPNTAATNSSITVIKVTGAGAVASSPAATTFTGMTDVDGSAVVNGIGGIGVVTDSSNRLYIVYSDSLVAGSTITAMYYTVLDTAFGVVLGKTLISAAGVFNSVALVESSTGRITAVMAPTTIGTVACFYAVVDATAVVTALTNIPNTAGLLIAGDAIVFNGSVAVPVASIARGNATASLQPTGFVMNLSGQPVMRCLPGLCDILNGTRVPRVVTINGNPHMLFSERGRLTYTSEEGVIIDVTPRGITRVEMVLVPPYKLPVTRVGETVFIGGAVPRIYDGQQIVEEGFPQFPEGLTVSTTGSAGHLSAGTYFWRAVYSWVDAQGQLHRSAVSPAVEDTASADETATVVVPTLPLSSKDTLPQGVGVIIELYRTVVNGGIFYRASSVSSPTFNSVSATTVSITDGLSDDNLVANELLYTTGGVMDWYAPPAYKISCNHKDRLVIAGLEDAYSWQSSSPVIPDQCVRFNPSWGGTVPAETGPITGLASMDGNLIIFTTLSAYVVQGDGPDLLGNNNWPPPQRITSVDAGATTWQSVLSTEFGVFFQSARGFQLLGRGLDCEYIGADVEAYGGLTVRCGAVLPASQQIRYQLDDGSGTAGMMLGTMLTSPGGICLVFDYYYKQWSVLQNYDATSACLYAGKYTRIKWNGLARQETPGQYGDAGFAYNLTTDGSVVTNWIKIADIQGFQRVRRALLLGTYGSNCTVTWEAAYNYSEDFEDSNTVTFDGNGVLTQGGPLQLRWLLSQQKCEAVRFRITDSNISGSGAGMALTGLTLEVGVKHGPMRLRAAQSL